MALPLQILERLPTRAVEAVRRVAVGVGLFQVALLERTIDDLAEAVDENTLLEPGLERRVAELERSLLPVLIARHEREARR